MPARFKLGDHTGEASLNACSWLSWMEWSGPTGSNAEAIGHLRSPSLCSTDIEVPEAGRVSAASCEIACRACTSAVPFEGRDSPPPPPFPMPNVPDPARDQLAAFGQTNHYRRRAPPQAASIQYLEQPDSRCRLGKTPGLHLRQSIFVLFRWVPGVLYGALWPILSVLSIYRVDWRLCTLWSSP
jgi:hypothetical protein